MTQGLRVGDFIPLSSCVVSTSLIQGDRTFNECASGVEVCSSYRTSHDCAPLRLFVPGSFREEFALSVCELLPGATKIRCKELFDS
jgi:hypothetical protein